MTYKRTWITTVFLATGCVSPAPGPGEPPPGATGSDSTGMSAVESQISSTWKVLNIQYQVQSTGYWCGPAATRIALSARIAPPSQQTLADQLGTTTNGTDWIGQVTRVANNDLGGAFYSTTEMPDDPPSPAQRDLLWRDVVLGVDANFPIVANIVAPPSNHPPGYPSDQTIFHYFTAIGYNPNTREVYIADPANFSGNSQYWLTLDKLASLIPPKGYASYRCGLAMTMGEIDRKYRALGGCGSFLGAALTPETVTPDGVGRYNVFENGSIYWSPSTGAFEVHGLIRDKYRDVGWEAGFLGYPILDELVTPDGVGRYSVFQGGSIYWSPSTGAHEVHGLIRNKWRDLGWEAGQLGYPTSDEYSVPEGRRSDFQHGSITVNAQTQATTAVFH
jgi:hypothetical protein